MWFESGRVFSSSAWPLRENTLCICVCYLKDTNVCSTYMPLWIVCYRVVHISLSYIHPYFIVAPHFSLLNFFCVHLPLTYNFRSVPTPSKFIFLFFLFSCFFLQWPWFFSLIFGFFQYFFCFVSSISKIFRVLIEEPIIHPGDLWCSFFGRSTQGQILSSRSGAKVALKHRAHVVHFSKPSPHTVNKLKYYLLKKNPNKDQSRPRQQ